MLESQVDDLITGEQVASSDNKIHCRVNSNPHERRKDLDTVPKETYERRKDLDTVPKETYEIDS